MSRLSNDILNKYIDNELDEKEMVKVSNQIEFSEEDRRNYIALKLVHDNLAHLKLSEPKTDFTSVLMSQLIKKKKSIKEQRIFFFSITSIIILACIIIIGYAMSVFLVSTPESVTNIDSVLSGFTGTLKEAFNTKNIAILGSVISFCFIITAYFFIDAVKSSKHKGIY